MNEVAFVFGITILMFLLFIVGCNVGVAMAVAGIVGVSFSMPITAGLSMVAQDFFTTFSSYPLTAITFFMLMGQYAYASGVGQRLFAAASGLLKNKRWGLPAAVILSAAGFAAICGSFTATSAAIGRVAIPELKKRGYNLEKVAAVIASGGVLGPLIPPSSILIIYGFLAEESVGTLFISGIVPGLILTGFFVMVCVILFQSQAHLLLVYKGKDTFSSDDICQISDYESRSLFSVVIRIVDVILVFVFVVVGIYMGWFTPTQGAVVGCMAMIIDGVLRKEMRFRDFVASTIDATSVALSIFVIIAGAMIYGRFLSLSGVSEFVANWLSSGKFGQFEKMLIIIGIYTLGGCFIDILPLILITVPIFLPIIKEHYDSIWFGIVLVLLCGIGVLTPPVGVNLFVVKGLDPRINLKHSFLYILMFIGAIYATLMVLLAFPILGRLGKYL